MVLDRTRPSRPADRTLRRIRATSGWGRSSSEARASTRTSTPAFDATAGISFPSLGSLIGYLLLAHDLGGRAPRSVQVARAPDGRGRGPQPFLRLGQSAFQTADSSHELAGRSLGFDDLALQLAPSIG